MGQLRVDFSSLRSLVGGIDKRIEEIEQPLAVLEQKIRMLTAAWDGAASEGFRRTQAEWFAAAGDLRQRLTDLRELVVTAHDNHAGAVRGNVAIWRV